MCEHGLDLGLQGVLLAHSGGLEWVVDHEGLGLLAHVAADLSLYFSALPVELVPRALPFVQRIFVRVLGVVIFLDTASKSITIIVMLNFISVMRCSTNISKVIL